MHFSHRVKGLCFKLHRLVAFPQFLWTPNDILTVGNMELVSQFLKSFPRHLRWWWWGEAGKESCSFLPGSSPCPGPGCWQPGQQVGTRTGPPAEALTRQLPPPRSPSKAPPNGRRPGTGFNAVRCLKNTSQPSQPIDGRGTAVPRRELAPKQALPRNPRMKQPCRIKPKTATQSSFLGIQRQPPARIRRW